MLKQKKPRFPLVKNDVTSVRWYRLTGKHARLSLRGTVSLRQLTVNREWRKKNKAVRRTTAK